MSMPEFSVIPELNLEDSITQIISSIAMEELALSHILNAEGEKLQYVLGTLESGSLATPPTLKELLEVNESVREMLSSVSMNQMFLMGKLSSAMSAYARIKGSGNNDDDDDDGGGGEDQTGLRVVDGAIIDGITLGDTSNWIEVAKYNDAYSLIVRQDFLNMYRNGHVGEVDWQQIYFGTTNVYNESALRNRINAWFSGPPDGTADRLSPTAQLRNFTVRNTVREAPGTAAFEMSKNDGFSNPRPIHDGDGDDVAFALSYGESVNFISLLYSWGGGQIEASPALAQANFDKLHIPATGSYAIWGRSSAGTIYGQQYAGVVSVNPGSLNGRVFRSAVSGVGLVYPALWVDSDILGYTIV